MLRARLVNDVFSNFGGYGACLPGCDGFGAYCEDGLVEATVEACDDGRNRATYNQAGCGPGCKLVPRCGDGRVDGLWGETCDDSNTRSNDGCDAACQLETRVN